MCTKPLWWRKPPSAIAKTFASASSSKRLRVATQRVQRTPGDLVAGGHQLPQDRPFANDFGVTPDISPPTAYWPPVHPDRPAAGLLALAGLLETLGNRHRIGRLATFEQLANLAVNPPVLVAVEIALRYQIGDLVEGGIVEQQATEDRLLGFQRVRRHAQLGKHGVRLWTALAAPRAIVRALPVLGEG
jgi:hypothetical protein